MTQKATPEDEIFNRLREAIQSRQLEPGTRLREVQIGEIFAATRGAVRKALRQLAFEGLVDLQPNRGASVARPTAKDAMDLFAARKCIEAAVAREAALRLTDADVTRLEKHIALEHAARDQRDDDAVVALSGEFHTQLAEIAGNSFLQRYMDDIIARESLIIKLFEKQEHEHCSADEHAQIVEALKSGDTALIDARITAHIDNIAACLDLEQREKETRTLEDVLLGR